MNDEVKRVFSPKLMTSFRSARKFSNYLVRTEIYPIERFTGSLKCSKKCCKVYEKEKKPENFTSSVTQKTYKTNHRLNCDDMCLIYFLTCKKCVKQYVVETTEMICKRWYNYKNNA